MLCSLSRTTGTGISANEADAEGGTIDAKVAQTSGDGARVPTDAVAEACDG